MDVLVDTNILIHRESDTIVREDLRILERSINEEGHRILAHPASIAEIRQDPDSERRESAESRVETYAELSFPPSPSPDNPFRDHVPEAPEDSNDRIDNMLLFAVYEGAVDFLITQDKGIHTKALYLEIEDRVFNIEDGIEYFVENEPSIRAPASIERTEFSELDLEDPIFDSLKEEYPEFVSWAESHPDRPAWVNYTDDDTIGAVMVIKPRETERIGTSPTLDRKSRVKISTLKVAQERWGSKVGELLLSIAIREAINLDIDEVYLTHYIEEEDYLVEMIESWGFENVSSTSDGEAIFLKRLTPPFGVHPSPIEMTNKYYPSFVDNDDISKFIVPIIPKYHNKLFTSYQWRDIPLEEFEGEFLSEGNAIQKAYLSNSNTRKVGAGDLLLFYRSRDDSQVTSLGVCTQVFYGLDDPDEISRIVGKRSVFSKKEIEEIAESPTTVLLFNWHFELSDPVSLEVLREDDVLNWAPQTIQELDEQEYTYIKENGGIDARFARH